MNGDFYRLDELQEKLVSLWIGLITFVEVPFPYKNRPK